MKKSVILSLLFVTASFFAELYAIPAFARKYNMTCKTCHAPFPRLKEYGEEFAGNGFILKDKDAPRYFVETGDEELSLIRDLPLAMRLEGYITYNHEQSKASDVYAPHLFKILSGGSLGGNVSYYLYYILEEGMSGKLEDAYIFFNEVFGTGLDVSVGQFQVCDPIAKRELRLSRDDYMMLKVKPGQSNINLAYDRGVMLSYSLPTETNLFLQVVNGSGIGAAAAFDNFDTDKHKNIFFMAAQDVAGLFTIGGNIYSGKEDLSASGLQTTSSITMAGGNLVTSLGPVDITALYEYRKDKNSFLNSLVTDIVTTGGMLEAIYLPNGDDSKWYAGGLFNLIESDDPGAKLKTVTGFGGYQVRRNVRLTCEYQYDMHHKYGTVATGFVAAF